MESGIDQTKEGKGRVEIIPVENGWLVLVFDFDDHRGYEPKKYVAHNIMQLTSIIAGIYQ